MREVLPQDSFTTARDTIKPKKGARQFLPLGVIFPLEEPISCLWLMFIQRRNMVSGMIYVRKPLKDFILVPI
jgi:hypothetical protein